MPWIISMVELETPFLVHQDQARPVCLARSHSWSNCGFCILASWEQKWSNGHELSYKKASYKKASYNRAMYKKASYKKASYKRARYKKARYKNNYL